MQTPHGHKHKSTGVHKVVSVHTCVHIHTNTYQHTHNSHTQQYWESLTTMEQEKHSSITHLISSDTQTIFNILILQHQKEK